MAVVLFCEDLGNINYKPDINSHSIPRGILRRLLYILACLSDIPDPQIRSYGFRFFIQKDSSIILVVYAFDLLYIHGFYMA